MPGIMLALRWSQALLLIPDGEAGGLESAEASAGLTHGNRLEVLGVWLVVGTAFAVTGWVTTGLIEVVSALGAPALLATTFELAVRVGVDAFGLVIVAALDVDLQRRQGQRPEGRQAPPRKAPCPPCPAWWVGQECSATA